MMTSDERIRLASLLLDAGLGGSAASVLEGVRGRAANDLRLNARGREPSPRVFGLLASESPGVPDFPIPIPLRAIAKSARRRSVDDSLGAAFAAVAARFGELALPPITCDLDEDLLAIEGPSLGLAAALALVGRVTGRAPSRPVFATGRVSPDGIVGKVGWVARKVAAAHRSGARDPIVLVPAEAPGDGGVATLEDAIERAFGARELTPSSEFVDLERVLARCGGPCGDRARYLAAAEELRAHATPQLPAADRAMLLYTASTQLRHAGAADAAHALGTEALEVLRAHAAAVPGDSVEFAEIDFVVSELDVSFDLEDAERRLRGLLARGLRSAHNELRCRGTLAMVLAMQGDTKAAVAMRRSTLELLERSMLIRREEARTLCCLVLEAAMAGDAALFERTARELAVVTPKTDAYQALFNASAVVRGLVMLGRQAEALSFARGETRAFEQWAPSPVREMLGSDAPIVQHPLISIARALIEANLALGSVSRAAALAERSELGAAENRHLLAWLGLLAALTFARNQDDHARCEVLVDRMRRVHACATSRFVDGQSLSSVWY